MKEKLIIEVMYKASYCLPCYYMDEAVKDILPAFLDQVDYRRVDILTPTGKQRFIDLSVSLFGEEGVFRHSRIAPIPSLFINGELCFDAIPPRHELEEAIREILSEACIL